MPLIRAAKLHYHTGERVLLSEASFTIQPGERISLIGRNGTGKTSLLKLIYNELQADSGSIEYAPNTIVSYLPQAILAFSKSVYDVIASGLGDIGKTILAYNTACQEAATGSETALASMAALQGQLDNNGGWALSQKVDAMVDKLNLPAEAMYNDLSGGMKRRVLLARALITEPDVLLLDEPTNHLDIESIVWLEHLIAKLSCAIITISHDRAFLEKITERVFYLDRGMLYDWQGSYSSALKKKAQALTEQVRAEAKFDKKLAEEEQWIRQGIKARRTRNEGRVRELKRMRQEAKQRIKQQGTVSAAISQSNRSGQDVIIAENISFNYPEKSIANNFSIDIVRGDRIAVVGPNGCGKTSLINLLLSRLKPISGHIKTGHNLEISYFDQLRENLDIEETVKENVSGGRDSVSVGGKEKHIISYLGDFLFTAERANSSIGKLSGGEINRLLLAKLFLQPSNLLILDEPTNDLDLETLELLEDMLADYKGTVILISHDRAFINQVATSIIGFIEPGNWQVLAGDYDDWYRYHSNFINTEKKQPLEKKDNRTAKKSSKNHNEQKQLEKKLKNITLKIEQLEEKMSLLQKEMAEPVFYEKSELERNKANKEYQAIESQLAASYSEWELLEGDNDID